MSKPETKPKTYLEIMEERLDTMQKIQVQDIATKEQLEAIIQSRHGGIVELKNSIKVFKDLSKITEPIKAIPGKDKKTTKKVNNKP